MGTLFPGSRRGSESRFRIRVLPVTLAVAGLMLGLPKLAWAPFTGGPSVLVSPNIKIEIRWTANFVGDGAVEIFDNPNGGVPIHGKASPVQGPGHTIEFTFGGVLQFDTTYFFRVIHKDPSNVQPDLTNDPAPYPPFFTGAQAISNGTPSRSPRTARSSRGRPTSSGSARSCTARPRSTRARSRTASTSRATLSSSRGCRPGRPISSASATGTRSTAPAWPRRRGSSRRPARPFRWRTRAGGT